MTGVGAVGIGAWSGVNGTPCGLRGVVFGQLRFGDRAGLEGDISGPFGWKGKLGFGGWVAHG